DDRVLGGVVDAETARRDEARHRRGVDDVAGLLRRDHARHERLDAVDDAPEIDAEHPLPVPVRGDSRPPHRATPALLQSTLTLPKALNARSASASTEARLVTSVRTPSASPPRASIDSTTATSARSSTSATTTRARSRAKSSAIARPIPPP